MESLGLRLVVTSKKGDVGILCMMLMVLLTLCAIRTVCCIHEVQCHTYCTYSKLCSPFLQITSIWGGGGERERERAYSWIQVVMFRAECNRTLVLQISLVQGLYWYACNLVCVCVPRLALHNQPTLHTHILLHITDSLTSLWQCTMGGGYLYTHCTYMWNMHTMT